MVPIIFTAITFQINGSRSTGAAIDGQKRGARTWKRKAVRCSTSQSSILKTRGNAQWPQFLLFCNATPQTSFLLLSRFFWLKTSASCSLHRSLSVSLPRASGSCSLTPPSLEQTRVPRLLFSRLETVQSIAPHSSNLNACHVTRWFQSCFTSPELQWRMWRFPRSASAAPTKIVCFIIIQFHPNV